jgi:hypothetical protein
MKTLVIVAALIAVTFGLQAQKLKESAVPAAVKSAFTQKYPKAAKVTWEKEKGNYEANWGGKSGEDNGVQFTPSGEFLEYAMAIPATELPASVSSYVKGHYKGQSIKEAAKVTDAKGTLTYEAEIKGKELIFDDKGNFLKENMGD